MKSNYFPGPDEPHLITGTPTFSNWRANFAQNNKNFHALLSDEDLIKIFRHRTGDSIRTVMDEMRDKYKGMAPEPAEAERLSRNAMQRGLDNPDHFAKWAIKQGAADPERHEGMTLYQLELEFAARNDPDRLLQLREHHNEMLSDAVVLKSYPQLDELWRWRNEQDHQADGSPIPGAYARREALTVFEEISEFEARNKDGYQQVVDMNNRAIAAREGASFDQPTEKYVLHQDKPENIPEAAAPKETVKEQEEQRAAMASRAFKDPVLDERIQALRDKVRAHAERPSAIDRVLASANKFVTDSPTFKSIRQKVEDFDQAHGIVDPNDPYLVRRKDRDSPAEVHEPGVSTMQNLGINVEGKAPTPESKTSENSTKQTIEDRLREMMGQAGKIFNNFAAATEDVFDAYRRERDASRQDRRRDNERI